MEDIPQFSLLPKRLTIHKNYRFTNRESCTVDRTGIANIPIAGDTVLKALDVDSSNVRDSEIREALCDWLSTNHSHQPHVIINELSIPRPSARIDVAMINGKICGFEIKSDVDNFDRFPLQKNSYEKVFEELTLVTTLSNLTKARKLTPKNWGLLVYCTEDGIKRVRNSVPRQPKSLECLLYVLTIDELLDATDMLDLPLKRSLPKGDIIIAILENCIKRDIICSAKLALKNRTVGAFYSKWNSSNIASA